MYLDTLESCDIANDICRYQNMMYSQLLDHFSYLRECLLKCCAFKIYPCYSTF